MSRDGRDETRDLQPERDVSRPRDPEPRARSDGRDLFTRHLDLPDGDARERVEGRERAYLLDAAEMRALAAIGAFRVVPVEDLHLRGGLADADLRRLSDEGLISCETLADVDGSRRIATLTSEGKDLLESHRHSERDGPDQAFYAGVVKPRELAHDAQVYRAFSEEAGRIEAEGGRVTRVILDYELKRDYQRFLHRDDRPDDATLESDRRAFAEAHDLSIVRGHLELPDLRIEYETEDGRVEHRDVEVVTEHYSRGQISGKSPRRLRLLPRERQPLGEGRDAVRPAASEPTVMTFDERVRALGLLGFTERQTRFLVTVALHGGFCLRRQYMAFAGVKYGAGVRDFLDRLVAQKLATRVDFRRDRGHVYHLQASAVYDAIGQPDNRNRRHVSTALVARKLMLLDYVLAHPDREWFATEEDKVALFTERFGVSRLALPQRLYVATRHGIPPTTRYFIHKLPIAVSEHPPAVSFVWLVTEVSGEAFEQFVHDHVPLLSELPQWRLVAVAPRHIPVSRPVDRRSIAWSRPWDTRGQRPTARPCARTLRHAGTSTPKTGAGSPSWSLTPFGRRARTSTAPSSRGSSTAGRPMATPSCRTAARPDSWPRSKTAAARSLQISCRTRMTASGRVRA